MYRQNDIIGYNGSLYQQSNVPGVYRRLECYLPASEVTYGEPIEATFYRLAGRIENGTLTPRFADGLPYEVHFEKMVPMKRRK